MKQRIIVYDLDGVIVDSRERTSKYIDIDALVKNNTPIFLESLQKWGETTEGDILIESGHKLIVALMASTLPDKMIALTSRSENGRFNTLNWLRDNTLLPIKAEWLIMRPYKEEGKSGIDYKKNIVTALMEEHDILYLVDDQPEIVDMYRSLGLTAIHFLLRDADCRMEFQKLNLTK